VEAHGESAELAGDAPRIERLEAPVSQRGERTSGFAETASEGAPQTDLAALKRITARLEAMPAGALLAPATDPRTGAVAALMVANYVAERQFAPRFEGLARAGFMEPFALTDLPVLARFVLRILPKVGTELAALHIQAPDELTRVCRSHRAELLEIAERHLGEIDEAHGRIKTVRCGASDADLVFDLRMLADVCRDYADVLARDKAAFTPALSLRARELADRLEEGLLGLAQAAPSPEAAEWRDYLRRASCALVSTYEEVARAGRFLFPHDKPEARFPHLASVLRVRRKSGAHMRERASLHEQQAHAQQAQALAASPAAVVRDAPAIAKPTVPSVRPPPPPATATAPSAAPPAASPIAPSTVGAPTPPAPLAEPLAAPLAAPPPPPPPAGPRLSSPEVALVELGPLRTSRDEASMAALIDRHRAPLPSVEIDQETLDEIASSHRISAAPPHVEGDRVPLEIEVGFTTDSNFFAGLSADALGVFVATYVVKAVGTPLRLTVHLPHLHEPVVLDGSVRWIREFSPTIETAPGMGVALDRVPADARKELDRFFAIRPPLYVDD
jgi:uncharacterized protein (TIGR02266 family)